MNSKTIAGALATLFMVGGCGEDAALEPDILNSESIARFAVTGQNLAVAGAGLYLQPSAMPIYVPVTAPEDILEATFYWTGRSTDPGGDDTIAIDGVNYTGSLVASYETGGPEPWLYFYRLDAMDLVSPGSQSFVISGFDPGGARKGGIALAVLYHDPASTWARVRIIEPHEFVHWDTPGHEQGAVWNFPFAPADEGRIAKLTIFTADCESSRPDRIWWESGPGEAPAGGLVGSGSGVFSNLLRSAYGPYLDVLQRPYLVVPAGAGHFAYQIESPTESADGDAIVHFFGAFAVSGDDPCTGSLGDRVWHDADGDGIQDAGEPGIEGAIVTLRDAAGALLDSAPTDADGIYGFGGLCAGTYVVEVATPDGFGPAPCNAGADDEMDGECSPVEVPLADDHSVVTGVDFGFVELAAPTAPGCFFGVGFWKHQFAVGTGEHGGRQHIPVAELEDLLGRVALATTLDYGGDDGVISFEEALEAFDPSGGQPSCMKARRHFLATLLNWAMNGSEAEIGVDTDHDGAEDMSFGDALVVLESMILEGETGARGTCADAAMMAKSINSMEREGCSF